MAGKLYGLGIGPGDPMLLTLKAKQVLETADVIAYPVKEDGEESTALNIVRQVIDLKNKKIMPFIFRMDKDKSQREKCREKAAAQIMEILAQGSDVAMITLGDVAIYSTYIYVHQMVQAAGYATEIIPGISSFSSGAALAQISLVEGNESLCIISSLKGRESLETAIDTFENLVLMKAGSSLKMIGDVLAQRALTDHALVISNAGMADEYIGKLDTDRTYGYFTTVIIKKNEVLTEV